MSPQGRALVSSVPGNHAYDYLFHLTALLNLGNFVEPPFLSHTVPLRAIYKMSTTYIQALRVRQPGNKFLCPDSFSDLGEVI